MRKSFSHINIYFLIFRRRFIFIYTLLCGTQYGVFIKRIMSNHARRPGNRYVIDNIFIGVIRNL